MSDTQSKIGKLLSEGEQRDAIHVAVAPAIAARRLRAGQHVGLAEDGRITDRTKKPIGIVDPFLPVVVLPNERCWLFLYPNTITSLRHEWVHPAFAVRDVVSPVAQAKAWITKFAEGYGVTYEEMVGAAADWVAGEEYFCRGGTFEGEYVPDEFWDHYEAATGRTVESGKRESFFTCSC